MVFDPLKSERHIKFSKQKRPAKANAIADHLF